MYDQIEANSELDFVAGLRREHGDEYAIATMKNHWAGYITDEMLDAAQQMGVSAMRIPVGYWIVDAPVGGSSPLEYGISPEGFVTGGLNHLHTMLVGLKRRGISALIDIHAHPCNSACVSNGLYCAAPLAFGVLHEWPIADGDEGHVDTVSIADLPRCAHADPAGGSVYKTTRTPTDEEGTWSDVAINAVGTLAKWIKTLPAEASCVIGFQLANEPALGPDIPAVTTGINLFYERAIVAAREHLPSLPLVLSWINPSPQIWPFLKSTDEADRAAKGGGILSDHHYYLNWQGCAERAHPRAKSEEHAPANVLALLRAPDHPSALLHALLRPSACAYDLSTPSALSHARQRIIPSYTISALPRTSTHNTLAQPHARMDACIPMLM